MSSDAVFSSVGSSASFSTICRASIVFARHLIPALKFKIRIGKGIFNLCSVSLRSEFFPISVIHNGQRVKPETKALIQLRATLRETSPQ